MNPTLRPFVVLLALASCRPVLPDDATFATAEELTAIDDARTVWLRRGLPYGATCEAQQGAIRIVRDANAFASVCGDVPRHADGTCPEGEESCSHGCYHLVRLPRSTASRQERATVVFGVAPELDAHDARRVLVHEALHWLGHCSGHGRDSWHLDESRWGDAATYPEGGMVREALDANGGA